MYTPSDRGHPRSNKAPSKYYKNVLHGTLVRIGAVRGNGDGKWRRGGAKWQTWQKCLSEKLRASGGNRFSSGTRASAPCPLPLHPVFPFSLFYFACFPSVNPRKVPSRKSLSFFQLFFCFLFFLFYFCVFRVRYVFVLLSQLLNIFLFTLGGRGCTEENFTGFLIILGIFLVPKSYKN